MDLFENIPLLILLAGIVFLFSWQWRKTRKLHKQFMNLPEEERKKEELLLHEKPFKNAYIRPQPNWLILISIIGMILLFVLIGLQKTGIK